MKIFHKSHIVPKFLLTNFRKKIPHFWHLLSLDLLICDRKLSHICDIICDHVIKHFCNRGLLIYFLKLAFFRCGQPFHYKYGKIYTIHNTLCMKNYKNSIGYSKFKKIAHNVGSSLNTTTNSNWLKIDLVLRKFDENTSILWNGLLSSLMLGEGGSFRKDCLSRLWSVWE
jgi:hypothetical protein